MAIIDFRDVIDGVIENLLHVKSWNSARRHEARCRTTQIVRREVGERMLIGLKRPHRIEMTPMRDGVKPYTVIILPRGAKDAPIVPTRTPNNAGRPVSNTDPSLEALLREADTEFVRVRIRNTRPK